ncbi:MAG TPA: hypothetical protein VHF25_05555 [Nitriliruptorales bacterium]|nr:hypothetical protein [Nitriliruptorales bacterium]
MAAFPPAAMLNLRGDLLLDLAEILLVTGARDRARAVARDAGDVFDRMGNRVACARARVRSWHTVVGAKPAVPVGPWGRRRPSTARAHPGLGVATESSAQPAPPDDPAPGWISTMTSP